MTYSLDERYNDLSKLHDELASLRTTTTDKLNKVAVHLSELQFLKDIRDGKLLVVSAADNQPVCLHYYKA